jgi:hypothetical protein
MLLLPVKQTASAVTTLLLLLVYEASVFSDTNIQTALALATVNVVSHTNY